MERVTATAITKYVRIPPRKARLAADIIRGMKVEDAALQLMASQLKAGKLLYKKSAKKRLESQRSTCRCRPST